MCHTATAAKFFNPEKGDEELTKAILKGRTDSKPPMPGYEAKGMKADEALALVSHMKGLRAAKKTE